MYALQSKLMIIMTTKISILQFQNCQTYQGKCLWFSLVRSTNLIVQKLYLILVNQTKIPDPLMSIKKTFALPIAKVNAKLFINSA